MQWTDTRSVMGLLVLSLFLPGFASSLQAQAPRRPNMIFIMADDLGYGDLGCYGQEEIATPHIDRLAAEGMRFTNYYAGCTVCRPSRLVLWSGLHTGHTPIDSNAPYVLQPQDVTVAELLQDAGYATGGVGKWSLGGVGTTGHPNLQGFDYWMGYLDQSEAHNYYPTYLWQNSEQVSLPGNVIGDYEGGRGRVSVQRVTYSHDVITQRMLDFVRRHRDGPFLLHVHWTLPHANNEAGRVLGDGMEVPTYGEYAQKDWPNPEKGFAAMLRRMDGDVGRLVSLLKELQIDQHTLVLFTSDNGPHAEGGHDHEFFNSNGPLRGYKRDLYEGGIRVPMIAWWPGHIPAGTVEDEPLAHYDWLPTACDLAGVSIPDAIDGISMVPALLGRPQPSHSYLYWSYETKRAVRRGKWKAVVPGKDKSLELYDLEEDLGETRNVVAEFPQVASAMSAILESVERERIARP
ncbi:MAG: N-acetylgalactosamine-6-sulfatase [Pirellulaceae bacterium]|nr:MAG: N-acetylgalactosamine-6-sulfatase [Pirellulaceae bacterium]